jgi:membrane protease YdiL (CAAX protease family)
MSKNVKSWLKIELHPPVSESIPGVWLRIWWMFAAMLLLPTGLGYCGCSGVAAVILAGLCGLSAGIMPLRLTGLRLMSWRDIGASFAVAAIIILISAAATAVWKIVLNIFHIEFPEKQQLAVLISDLSGFELLTLFIALCIVSPLLEELLFRRMIYEKWYELHADTAFVGTALLFSVIHVFLAGIPGLFILGCGFQYIYLRQKNLCCAVLTHSLVNICAFAVNCISF